MKLNFKLIVLLLVLIVLILINTNKNSLENVNKCCIAILTRGYSDIREYENLIKRNKKILSNLYDKSIDNLIFHEGNITKKQQLYIKKQTPELKLIFIDISGNAFKKDKQNIKIEEEPNFKIIEEENDKKFQKEHIITRKLLSQSFNVNYPQIKEFWKKYGW